MGFRFRKSFKLMPGVRLNLSGKSAGIRIGGKHAGVSFNSKRGVRASASIPSTGLSYSTKIGGSEKKKTSAKGKTAAPGATAPAQKTYSEPRKTTYFEFDWSSPGGLLVALLIAFAVIALFVVLYNAFGGELALLATIIIGAVGGFAYMVLSLVLTKPVKETTQSNENDN